MAQQPVQMGPNAVTNPAQLISMLKSGQPAQNPGTPNERINPEDKVLEHMKSAQYSLEQAKAFTNDMHMLAVFDILQGTLKAALLKFDGPTTLESLREKVQAVPPMVGPAPGMNPSPMGGQPPMGPQAAPQQPPPQVAA